MFITEGLAQQPGSLDAKDVYTLALSVLGLVGGVLAAVGAVVGFFLTRYWNTKDREFAEKSRMRDILYESLKWFEGGTQKRSIGIAVVNSSWASFEDFRRLWIEVFANQAIYLLAGSNQGTDPHEHDNLRRLMELLVREQKLVEPTTASLLATTLKEKRGGKISSGLTLTTGLRGLLPPWCQAFP